MRVWPTGSARQPALIEQNEIKAATAAAFPGRGVLRIEPLKAGFDFDVRRIDFYDGESVVFRGQRNQESDYYGRIDWGDILADEIEFYRMLPNLPVPRLIHFEPNEAALGFPYAFFTHLPGTPLEDLLPLASTAQRRGAAREMGALLGTIHGVRPMRVGRLTGEPSPSWGDYLSHRMRNRLEPHTKDGLITSRDVNAIVARAADVELDQPRLLHMDFREANLLADLADGALNIVGIVDAANSLAGDAAFDLARVDEGVGLDSDFWEGYETVFGQTERNSEVYQLYRLETAALLAHVYGDSSQAAFRRERFAALTRQVA